MKKNETIDYRMKPMKSVYAMDESEFIVEIRKFENWLTRTVIEEMKGFNPQKEQKRALGFVMGVRERIDKVLSENPPNDVFIKDVQKRERNINRMKEQIIKEIGLLKVEIKNGIKEDSKEEISPSYIGYVG